MFSYRKATRWFLAISGFTLTASLAACQSPQASAPATSPAAVAEGENISLSGAGASFPAPLYQRWFAEYNKQHPNI
jgi:phosphate transport system substrate-binding protein